MCHDYGGALSSDYSISDASVRDSICTPLVTLLTEPSDYPFCTLTFSALIAMNINQEIVGATTVFAAAIFKVVNNLVVPGPKALAPRTAAQPNFQLVKNQVAPERGRKPGG